MFDWISNLALCSFAFIFFLLHSQITLQYFEKSVEQYVTKNHLKSFNSSLKLLTRNYVKNSIEKKKWVSGAYKEYIAYYRQMQTLMISEKVVGKTKRLSLHVSRIFGKLIKNVLHM